MILYSGSGKAIQKANLMKDGLTQMRFDMSLYKELGTKISSTLNTRKKAPKKAFQLFE